MAAMQGQDAVLSALGPAAGTPAGTLISSGMRHVMQAMHEHGARRLIFESGLMVGDLTHLNPLKRMTIALFRRWHQDLYEDKVRAEQLIVDSSLEWTIVRPPSLKDGPARGKYTVGTNLNVDIFAGLSHADIADFMVKSLGDTAHTKQIVDITY